MVSSHATGCLKVAALSRGHCHRNHCSHRYRSVVFCCGLRNYGQTRFRAIWVEHEFQVLILSNIDGLNCCNSSALTMELLHSCTKPSIYSCSILPLFDLNFQYFQLYESNRNLSRDNCGYGTWAPCQSGRNSIIGNQISVACYCGWPIEQRQQYNVLGIIRSGLKFLGETHNSNQFICSEYTPEKVFMMNIMN